MQPLESHPGCFVVVLPLPPGYHQYKFIVDGEWQHNEQEPFTQDPLGNINNWVLVKRPEGELAALHQARASSFVQRRGE